MVAFCGRAGFEPWSLHRNIWLHLLFHVNFPVSACHYSPYRLHYSFFHT